MRNCLRFSGPVRVARAAFTVKRVLRYPKHQRDVPGRLHPHDGVRRADILFSAGPARQRPSLPSLEGRAWNLQRSRLRLHHHQAWYCGCSGWRACRRCSWGGSLRVVRVVNGRSGNMATDSHDRRERTSNIVLGAGSLVGGAYYFFFAAQPVGGITLALVGCIAFLDNLLMGRAMPRKKRITLAITLTVLAVGAGILLRVAGHH